MSAQATTNTLQNRFTEVMQDQQSESLSQLHSLDDLWPVMRERPNARHKKSLF
jgi:hypothetical protein